MKSLASFVARQNRGGALRARRINGINLLSIAVAGAAAQMSSNIAIADSGNGVDTVLGNAMNPAGFSTFREKDPDGLGESPDSRSPTGLRTREPFRVKEPNTNANGWLYNANAEVGLIGGNATTARAAKLIEYRDLDDGLLLNTFGLQLAKPADAAFFEINGGGVGRQDQFYSLNFGHYNDWKVKAFYNETPHVFTTTYRSLWSGIGSDTLTLNGLPAGGGASAAAAQTAIRNTLAATPYGELSLVRKKGGARFDLNLTDSWKFFASYSNERRQGARPFGTVFGGGGGGGNIETAESIDYTTHDLLAGLQFADSLQSFNLQLAASLFRNNIDTLTIENPLFVTINGAVSTSGNITRARYDLYPDNNFINLKSEYARRLPDFYDGRFTAAVSLAKLSQNDNLIAPSVNDLSASATAIGGATIGSGQWNTTNSLSRQTADAEIDTKLVDLGLRLTPLNDFDVQGKLRYYETQNKTVYWACNPLTGQWGRVINDGSGSALLATNYSAGGCNAAATQALGIVPAAGNINIRNMPFEYKQLNYTVGADYRLNRTNSFNAAWERETYDRKHRERDETWEDKLKFGYINRGFEEGSLRVSFEHDRRRGSTYRADPYDEFYSASLGPMPTANGTNVASWVHNIEQFRKFDLADRDQNILNGRLNYALAEGWDAGVSAQFKDINYPASAYGRDSKQKQNSLNFDLTWTPNEQMSVFAYYSFQQARMKQASIWPNACVIGSTYYFFSDGTINTTGVVPAGTSLQGSTAVTAGNFLSVCGSASAFSPLYPTSRMWDVTQDDRNNVLGLGLNYNFGKVRLDMNYTFSQGRTKIHYGYNPTALGMTALQTGLAGDGWSDMTFSVSTLENNLMIPLDKQTTVRLLHRYEVGKVNDWHYDGVAANPMPTNNTAYLDAGPQRYRATLFGAMLMIDL